VVSQRRGDGGFDGFGRLDEYAAESSVSKQLKSGRVAIARECAAASTLALRPIDSMPPTP